MRLVRTFHKPFRDWMLFAGALFLLALARVSLLVFPFRVVRSLVDSWKSISFPQSGAGPDERSIPAIMAASRFVPGAMCLAQSLALEILLTRRGIESRTRFGVAKATDGRLKAHAWVESCGQQVSGFPVGEQFITLTLSGARML